jgi:hypothetical protein
MFLQMPNLAKKSSSCRLPICAFTTLIAAATIVGAGIAARVKKSKQEIRES